ncbi:7TM diverse intracellular signaling domain-containing protein [Pseudobacteriovorax antillogorgiicola]|uniref:histidine kinase n=1 Tax=Pseudobacteriovorax antillogorgiicola TaxID=1513793 RepID=A0A1Y6BBL4_9BACT|nr:7TM diverse intracellular signaling domain-containing protein [Pseudobacteriovorax antillogorgiicola]TCS58795.1 Hpt domain-containing protein [Pseudobacteriovorax antillogorgiicola]SME94641.1 Hpt domain-containing protein [Pseudobacteriovorax antillogorgiicola]
MFLVRFFLLLLVMALPAESQGFEQTWVLHRSDLETPATATAETLWEPVTANAPPFGFNKTVWLKNTLGTLDSPTYLYYPNGVEDIQIYIGDDLIYSYGSFDSSWDHVATQTLHIVPLSAEHQGKEIFIRLHYGVSYLMKGFVPQLSSDIDSIIQSVGQRAIVTSFVIGIFFLLGLLSAMVVAIKRQIDISFYYACMSLAAVVWMFVNQDSTIKFFIEVDPFLATRIDAVSLLLGCSGFFGFLNEVASSHKKLMALSSRIARWLFFGSAALLFLPILSPWYLIPALHIFAIFGFSSFALYLYSAARSIRNNRESQLIVAAILAIIIGSVHDILRYTAWFPSPIESMIPIGIAIATIFMGSIVYFRLRAEQVSYIDQIKDLNTNLEGKVEEKTRDIRSILKNLPQGVFQITADSSLTIGEDYSKSLELILDETEIIGKDPIDLIFNQSDLSSDVKSLIATTLLCALEEDEIAWEANSHLLPHVMGLNDRVIEVDWQHVANADSTVEKILVSLKDVTQLRNLEEEARQQTELANMITEIMDQDVDKISFFVEFSIDLIREAFDQFNDGNYKIVFRNLHTIKGNARTYGFTGVVDSSHQAESELARLIQGEDSRIDACRHEMKETQLSLEAYEQALKKLNLGQENMVRVDKQSLIHLCQEASQCESFDDFRTLTQKILFLVEKNLAQVIEPDIKSLKFMSEKLGKPTPHVVIENDQYVIDKAHRRLLTKTFNHILANAVAHGIESPEERRQSGKAEVGTIRIHIIDTGEGLCISVRDDGRGLAIGSLREKALEQGFINAEETGKLQKIADFIFDSGVSTAQTLDQIAGRGVGLDAVRSFVESYGGCLEIELLSEKDAAFMPFQFKMIVPQSSTTSAA